MTPGTPAYLTASSLELLGGFGRRARRPSTSSARASSVGGLGGIGEGGDLERALEAERRANRRELGLAGLAGPQLVERVRLRTALTPELSWSPGAGGPPQQSGGGFGRWLLQLLRPDLEAETALGPWDWRPYGRSNGEYWPLVAGALGVGLLGGLYLLLRGAWSLFTGSRAARAGAAA